MRILFIINPHAGSRTTEKFDATLEATLAKVCESRRVCPETEQLVSNTPEQLRESLRERLMRGNIDVVAVVGGDGTVMEVLPVMLEFPDVRLALIPYGTGNLLAVNLGIPRDLQASLDVALRGVPRRIDIGRIGRHYFALLAGVGTVAEIMENTPSRHKRLLGMWAYLVDGVRSIMAARRAWFRVTIDSRTLSAAGVAVVVSNAAALMRPCPALTPEAVPDDGLLDICVIRSQSRRDYLPTVFQVLTRQHVESPTPTVSYYRGRNIRIDSWPRLKVQADGNIIGKTPVEIDIIKERLNVMVPADAMSPGISRQEEVQDEGVLELFKRYFVSI